MAHDATEHPIITHEIAEGRIHDAIYSARCAIGTLNHLMHEVLWHGGDVGFSNQSLHGLHVLFDVQVNTLIAAEQKAAEIVAENQELRATVGKMNSVGRDDPAVDTIRSKIIADQIAAGAHHGALATAMNMKLSSVEKVIAKLKGGPDAATPSLNHAKAVNG